MRESSIERRVCAEVVKRGGIALKLANPAGIPDRLFLGPKGNVIFIEFKRPGGRLRELQEVWGHRLHDLGFHVARMDTAADTNILCQLLGLEG